MNLDYIRDSDGASFEKDHWWVRSRFRLLDRVLKRMPPTISLAVLDVGCGTGVNLDYLELHYGQRLMTLIGVDPDAEPQSQGHRVVQRDLPVGKSFDLILLMDILEHVAQPLDLLKHLFTLLKPTGLLLVTVPAFSWLWTTYDELAHHRKRYGLRELTSELQAAHFDLIECFFLFGTTFPLCVVQRFALKCRPQNDARLFKPVASWLNSLLYAATALEMRTWMPYNRCFGSSIVALAKRAETLVS